MSKKPEAELPLTLEGRPDLERLLRREFARELEAQRLQVPSPKAILLAARLRAAVERRAKATGVAVWCECLLLAVAAASVALGWSAAAEAPRLSGAEPEILLETGLGPACLLLGLALYWTRGLVRLG